MLEGHRPKAHFILLIALCMILLSFQAVFADDSDITDEENTLYRWSVMIIDDLEHGEALDPARTYLFLWNTGMLDDYYVHDGEPIILNDHPYTAYNSLTLEQLEEALSNTFVTFPDVNEWAPTMGVYDESTGIVKIPTIGFGSVSSKICLSKCRVDNRIYIQGVALLPTNGDDTIRFHYPKDAEYAYDIVPKELCLVEEGEHLLIDSFTDLDYFVTPIDQFDPEEHLYEIETGAIFDKCSFDVDEGCATTSDDLAALTSHFEHNDDNWIPDGEEFRMDLSPKEGYLLDAVALITEDGSRLLKVLTASIPSFQKERSL